LTTVQMMALAAVSRATYYHFNLDATPAGRDAELRDAIQRIALSFPAEGRQRITAEVGRWQVALHQRWLPGPRLSCQGRLKIRSSALWVEVFKNI
jgi:hypothetical protein